MWAAWLGFVVLAVNPFGGLLIAIPYGQHVLHLSPWLAAAIGWPLAYVQVLFVDALWDTLCRWAWFERVVHRRSTPRLERMASSAYTFWMVLGLGSFFGPWLVMAIMRYAKVPQRRIALPMALNIAWNALAIAVVSLYAPRLLTH